MELVVGAVVAVAVLGAEFAGGEAFAVHFEAFSFFAGAAAFFLFEGGGVVDCVHAEVFLEGEFFITEVVCLLGEGVVGLVEFVSLD